MADYFQIKNQNIFNPPANTNMGNVNSPYNSMYVQNALVLGNVSVNSATIIAPRVTTITYPGDDTAADTAGGQTITLTGTGFVAGASVLINGSAVGVVSVVSSTVITFTSPANTTGSYVIYVVNPDGSTAIAIPGIQYSGTPNWTTAAGTLGNVYETASFNQSVTATGDAPITYSVVSGSLPPGSTFNANGTITGTSQLSASPTTYSFTVRATDAEQQDTNRAFSIAVIPDVVTWSNPANNETYSPAANIAIANITLSATSAVGSGITYSANTLPTGLSLTGANISGTPTVIANTSSLLTATANTTSESSSITINWSVSVASDPYFMYNSLLLPGNGTNGAQNNTFLDGSTNNFTITRNGNTTQGTFSPYGGNWSNYFDGTGDFLSLSTVTALQMTGDFTWEAWVYPLSLPSSGNYKTLWAQRASSAGIGGPAVVFDSTGALLLFISNSAASEWAISGFITALTVSPNQWQHIALVKNGTSLILYKNGVAGTATTSSQAVGTSSNTTLMAGAADGSQTVDGYMSNFRAVKGTAVYTSNFTPSTTPLTAISGTQLLTCQSNRFLDNSTNNFTITKNGDTSVQRFSPFSPTAAYSTSTIGGSGYFDGAGDFLTAPSGSGSLGTGNFTVEGWIYCTANSISFPTIFSNYSGAGGTAFAIFSSYNNNRITLYVGGSTAVAASTTITLNTWIHVAAVRNSGVVTLYINGVSQGTVSYSGSSSGDGIARIGCAGDAPTTTNFTGYITNVRWVIGTAVYTSNFTPPTAPVTAITNTSLLTNFTNAGIIDNTMMNNLETGGNAQISSAQTKFGSGSMSFDGNDDYLVMPATTNLIFNGSFTIEFWINFTATPSSYIILMAGTTANTQLFITTKVNGQGLRFGLSGVAEYAAGTQSWTTGTWYHVALVRNITGVKFYVNGTDVTDSTYTNSTSYSGVLQIGGNAPGTVALNGYLDDLRITKGYARYTSNFTPPTSAFPTY